MHEQSVLFLRTSTNHRNFKTWLEPLLISQLNFANCTQFAGFCVNEKVLNSQSSGVLFDTKLIYDVTQANCDNVISKDVTKSLRGSQKKFITNCPDFKIVLTLKVPANPSWIISYIRFKSVKVDKVTITVGSNPPFNVSAFWRAWHYVPDRPSTDTSTFRFWTFASCETESSETFSSYHFSIYLTHHSRIWTQIPKLNVQVGPLRRFTVQQRLFVNRIV